MSEPQPKPTPAQRIRVLKEILRGMRIELETGLPWPPPKFIGLVVGPTGELQSNGQQNGAHAT